MEVTIREAGVLQLVARGYSAPEIATWLHVHPTTVAVVVRRLVVKASVTTMAERRQKASQVT